MRSIIAILVLAPILGSRAADAQTAAPAIAPLPPPLEAVELEAEAGRLVVGIAEMPPYAIALDDGAWSGIAVDLWRMTAEELDLDYEFAPAESTGLHAGVVDGRFDIAFPVVAASAVERSADLTIPFDAAPIGVAEMRSSGLLDVVRNLLGLQFLIIVATLSALLLAVGAVVWLIERRRNADQFSPGVVRGLGDGFWWAGVTLTTIGYGDKAPVTPAGRAVAMLWMLVGLVVSSALTASLVTLAGVDDGSRRVVLPDDLRGDRVGVVSDGIVAGLLDDAEIAYETVETIQTGLAAVRAGRLDAFVGPAPTLSTAVTGALTVEETRLQPLLVTMAASEGSDLVERLDHAFLARMASPGWLDLRQRYAD